MSRAKNLTPLTADGALASDVIERAIAALGYDANNTKAEAAAYEALMGCCQIGGH